MPSADSVETGELERLLASSAAKHGRLCPRQVLGARIGLAALRELGLAPGDRALVAITETDGCFVDGLVAAAGVDVGYRTLRLIDLGKVAVTFVDLRWETAVRLMPRAGIRDEASGYAPDEPRRYYAQLAAYQRMPDAVLLRAQQVVLSRALLTELRGQAGVRVECRQCGEEVIDGREVSVGGRLLCRSCAGEAYYELAGDISRAMDGSPPNLAYALPGTMRRVTR